MIRLSCSPDVQRIGKGMKNPFQMSNMLQTSLDTTGSYLGRQDILCQFHTSRSKEDEPLKTYFSKCSTYRIKLDHADNAINDRDFHTQIFTSLPSKYAMIKMVIKHERPLPTSEEAMHDLCELDTTASHMKELGDASRVGVAVLQCAGYHGRGCGRGHCRRGGRGGPS